MIIYWWVVVQARTSVRSTGRMLEFILLVSWRTEEWWWDRRDEHGWRVVGDHTMSRGVARPEEVLKSVVWLMMSTRLGCFGVVEN